MFFILLYVCLALVALIGILRIVKPYESKMLFRIIKVVIPIFRGIRNNVTVDKYWYQVYDSKSKTEPASSLNSASRVAFYSIDQDEGYSWDQVEAESNRMARFLKNQGVGPMDRIAIMMQNHPRYMTIWLGAAKIGATSALINFNIKGHALSHALKLSEAKLVIFDSEYSEEIKEVSAELQSNFRHTIQFFHLNGAGTFGQNYDEITQSISTERLPASDMASNNRVKCTDCLFYIYTSGTTGLPKAAKISHIKFWGAGVMFSGFFGYVQTDRIYTPLPLYHFAGGVGGISATLRCGGCLYIRKKFSVSKFVDDCVSHKITVIQYIGELCRYLANSKETGKEHLLNIRLAIGNGLRPDVWTRFQKRFHITQIGEFYGATESPAAFFNIFNKPGAIGFCPPLIQKIFGVKLIQYDLEKDEAIRGPDGLCVPAPPGGVGELVARSMGRKGVGYTSAEATEKKFIQNVFKKGDEWFRNGDLIRIDKDGWVYFVDRLGDTFRWKGENVATSEVDEVIARFHWNGQEILEEVTSYGVQIPETDGRAGMASIRYLGDFEKFPWTEFVKYLSTELPTYAIPIFLRFTNELPVNYTFKYPKTELKRQGFNVLEYPDEQFFYFDQSLKKYLPLTKEIYQDILDKKLRF